MIVTSQIVTGDLHRTRRNIGPTTICPGAEKHDNLIMILPIDRHLDVIFMLQHWFELYRFCWGGCTPNDDSQKCCLQTIK